MKRWLWLLGLLWLVACGGQEEARPTSTAVETDVPQAAAVAPTGTLPAVIDTVAPTPMPMATATLAPRTSAVPTAAPASPSPSEGPLPRLVAQTTLGDGDPVCAGEGMTVQEGVVYTWGQQDGQQCASAIALDTGVVSPTDPAVAVPPPATPLQVVDLERGRTYVAEGGVVTAYDAAGQEIGPVLRVPPGEPPGFGFATSLQLAPDGERLYLSYQDFDGHSWLAMADLATGETRADVPVPSGPWGLSGEGDLVFVDSSRLLVRDGATLALVARHALSRRPVDAVSDPASGRLFVADAGGDVHVLDAVTLAEEGRLPGVGAGVDLDPRLGRLYAGDGYGDGTSVYDLASLAFLGRIPQPGQPFASPADGQVYILEEGVYQADGATLTLVTGRTVRKGGCNGCVFPTDVVVDPGSGLVYTATYGIWVGKPGPTSQAAVDPQTGRAFVARTTGGYQVAYSVALYPDLTLGAPRRWIDGLYGQPLYNPVGGQLYLAHGQRLLVLDGADLALLGGMDVGEGAQLLTVDPADGALFVAQGARLSRFAATGAALEAPPPEPVVGLPGPVYGIAVSPAFLQDATLFVRATDRESGQAGLYRSTDGGGSWMHLRGGLPGPPNDLVFAPDGALYAALVPSGWQGPVQSAAWGEGVYRSTDGGDRWQPVNQGLTHLRVARLHVDAAKGTLYARCTAAAEVGGAALGDTLWSRPLDDAAAWAPVTAPEAGPLRLVDYAVPYTYTQAVQRYWHALTGGGPLYQSWGELLRRSDDGGVTWQELAQGPADYAEDVLTAPDGQTVYWAGPDALWCTTDEGATWAVSRHPALDGAAPFTMRVADVSDIETLFLGTEDGQVLILPAYAAQWEALER